MRPLSLILGAAVALAAPALAQTAGAASNGSTTLGTAAMANGAGRTPQLGQPPAPLGTTTTLSERIDQAAGLDSRRAIINGTAGSLGPSANRSTGTTLPGSTQLESAGRPAGVPLGAGTSGTAMAGTPAPTPSADPRNPR